MPYGVIGWERVNPLQTNDSYNMSYGCAHFFHTPIRINLGVLILGVKNFLHGFSLFRPLLPYTCRWYRVIPRNALPTGFEICTPCKHIDPINKDINCHYGASLNTG